MPFNVGDAVVAAKKLTDAGSGSTVPKGTPGTVLAPDPKFSQFNKVDFGPVYGIWFVTNGEITAG